MGTATAKVQPEQLLKDLRHLWADLAQQQEHGVLRACAMTLVVAVDDSQKDADNISETIAALMHEHPSRAIVIRVRKDAAELLEARVFAQCWMPFGSRQQICCEQIEIRSSSASLDDVPTVIRGVTVPDLPVVLYCPNPLLCSTKDFQQLVPLADKLIIDSASAENTATLSYLTSLPATIRKADLAWGRLTPWRESIERLFDDPVYRGAAHSLTRVQIQYAGATESVPVYYLAAWFASALGSRVQLDISHGEGPAYDAVTRIDLQGPNFNATLDLVENDAVEVRVDGVRQQILFPELTDYEVLGKELSILGRDQIFDDVLVRANAIKDAA